MPLGSVLLSKCFKASSGQKKLQTVAVHIEEGWFCCGWEDVVFTKVDAFVSSEILPQIKIDPLVFDESVVAVSVALAILLVLKS